MAGVGQQLFGEQFHNASCGLFCKNVILELSMGRNILLGSKDLGFMYLES